jgi:hypothetical protein
MASELVACAHRMASHVFRLVISAAAARAGGKGEGVTVSGHTVRMACDVPLSLMLSAAETVVVVVAGGGGTVSWHTGERPPKPPRCCDVCVWGNRRWGRAEGSE